jgi:formylglycine-generating enzyme required for sulfatase activity
VNCPRASWIRLLGGALASLVLLILDPSAGFAEKRLALVIGNAGYRDAGRLANPVNDAQDLAGALTRLQFEVTLEKDLTLAKFSRAITDFAAKARGADVALFYFSGHGLQLNGVNYLMPVDAKLENEFDVKLQTISAQDVVEVLERAARMTLVLLDACRDNPIAERLFNTLYAGGRSGAVGKGLARMPDRASETLIVYAAEAGKVAQDGMARNSPFAAAMLKHIEEPGLEVELMLKRVTADVLEATAKKQQPERVSHLVSEFYFKSAAAPPRREPPKPPAGGLAVGTFDMKRAPAPLTQAEEASLQPRNTFKECPACPLMLVLPSGSFVMGSPESQYGHSSSEKPQHSVTIAHPFAVGRFEVTVGEFVEFLNDAAQHGQIAERWVATAPEEKEAPIVRSNEGKIAHFSVQGDQEQFPVTFVSWRGAAEYVKWLSLRTGATYRLLSEAEWEYAARAGSKTAYHFGDDALKLCDYGNVADASGGAKHNWSLFTDCEDGYPDLAPVGRFQPNAFGLYDMIGNAAEWVEDCGHPNYDGAPNDGSSWTSGSSCNGHEVRGGSYFNLSSAQRSAKRFENPSNTKYSTIGFRVARSLQP